MGISRILLGFGGVAAGVAVICNLPVFVPLIQPAALKYLANGKLQTLDDKPKNFSEAQGLSSLKSELTSHGVHLYAVVHQTLGVDKFQPYFDGDIFLDVEKTFYGPKERWMSLFLIFRAGVLRNGWRAYKKGIEGNLEGEGRLLGGVFLIGPGEQGILFEHREKEFGDHADVKDILDALKKIKK